MELILQEHSYLINRWENNKVLIQRKGKNLNQNRNQSQSQNRNRNRNKRKEEYFLDNEDNKKN